MNQTIKCLWLALSMLPLLLEAQDVPETSARSEPGTQLILHTGMHAPTGELALRFGAANTVGMGVRRTTSSGWRFGGQWRFQTGSDVRQIGLLQNLIDPNGHVIDNEGRIALVTPQQRGSLFFGTIGRKWPLGWGQAETGFIAELGAGYWEHKIHFQNRGNRVTQLDEPHVQGYDRLSGGAVLLPRFGVEHHSASGQLRFHIGIEGMLGRIQPSRGWNTDTQSADSEVRNDTAWGLFAGWILRLKARTTSVDYYH